MSRVDTNLIWERLPSAEDAFASYDFSPFVVQDWGKWAVEEHSSYPTRTLKRTMAFETDRGGTFYRSFYVVFHPRSTVAAEWYLSDGPS